ncbi:hypothetical protein DICPUDRAFT_32986 [Dictyostelium purpureum]|uniref:SCP domain-containing protein n=1 Tax=Dictyostelium purpureum TaxID=5786 RepID=F0ZK28_DICPU|nr:uncharacterized protein DICPUDRAFT_32986 [Dictyostelium purpureum]EGC35719.1 hypothetical protein DICPUDRAFT_32986 [Dictyostelium purpureum]|eukprot:XP_003287775.1 hypothetical protein DICPUDRAFT_32986 [Dictyostelium purpureum]
MKLILNLIILISFIGLINCYGESDSEGNPNYLERESHNMLNVVRMFPREYKRDFMVGFQGIDDILTESRYPSGVNPLFYYNSLNRLAKAHSFDMATKETSTSKCFQHNDCNGTTVNDRFKNWDSCIEKGAYGENIAWAKPPQTGIATNNQLICEKFNAPCPSDQVVAEIGHRDIIMSFDYPFYSVGVGNYESEFNSLYWTQDFLGTQCVSAPQSPIYSGYHTYYPATSGETLFLVTFYSPKGALVAKKMNIVFSNTKINIPLRYGNSTFGIYSHKATTFTDCQQYYFETTTTDNKVFRYPETGYLQTTKTSSTCVGWNLEGNNFVVPSSSEETTDSSGSSSEETTNSSEQDGSDPNNSNILKLNGLLVLLFLNVLLFI